MTEPKQIKTNQGTIVITHYYDDTVNRDMIQVYLAKNKGLGVDLMLYHGSIDAYDVRYIVNRKIIDKEVRCVTYSK